MKVLYHWLVSSETSENCRAAIAGLVKLNQNLKITPLFRSLRRVFFVIGRTCWPVTVLLTFYFLLYSSPLWANSKVQNYLGSKSFHQNNFEEAAKNFQNDVVDHPENAESLYNLGSTYYRLKQYDKASEAFVKAAQLTDQSSIKLSSLYNLGNSLYRLNELEKSIAAYEEALKVDAKDEQTKLNLEFVKQKLQKKKQKQTEEQNQKQQEQEQNSQNAKNDQNSNSNEASDKSKQGSEQKQGNDEIKQQNQTNDQSNAQNNENGKNSQQEQQSQQSQQSGAQNKDEAQQSQGTSASDHSSDNSEAKGKSNSDPSQGDTNSKSSTVQAELQKDEPNSQQKREAEIWLGAIDENKAQIMKNQIDKQLGRGRKIGKDW